MIRILACHSGARAKRGNPESMNTHLIHGAPSVFMDCILNAAWFGAALFGESPKLAPRDGVATPSRGRRAIVEWIDRERSSGISDPHRSPRAIRTVERPSRPHAIQDA